MPHHRILWTASTVSLPSELLDRLKEKGCEVLVASEGATRPWSQIQRLSPRVWVADVDSEAEKVFRTIEKVSNKDNGTSVLLFSKRPTVEEAVKAIKAGAKEYMPAGVDTERLWAALQACLECLPGRQGSKEDRFSPSVEAGQVVAYDPVMKTVVEMAAKAAKRDATILLEGESGSGKEVLARYIHQQSPRNEGPFVAVNCAALPENLLESELFGHEKGAFTGATSRKQGKFELAHGGTLLLDEISEMAPSIQAKLLRALQERQIDRVGGRYPVEVDVRVIATTNRNLAEETRKGNFRLDLYYRLNVVPLRLPPLRERKADIIPLAQLFLHRYAYRYGETAKILTKEAESFLQSYDWPGNVRELENLMERICIFVDSKSITKDHVENLLYLQSGPTDPQTTDAPVMPLKEMEKKMIMKALKNHNGNRTHAAKVLGISVRTLRNKLNEYKKELEG
ncbi:MAG: sigma-54-dependent Fis family transcriptional regulator [Deltaproteobacteria bacterium]|nr:MAG: sigma-54-dependent Fis family transcriptional regulator [Deltaproteobacteria bacterium]